MPRYIDAEKLYDKCNRFNGASYYDNRDEDVILDLIENEPTVVPAVHAHWIIRYEGTYSYRRTYCSNCQKRSGIGGILENQLKPYCPNCGATMSDEAVEELHFKKRTSKGE